ncbi:MAG: H-X9-DG-CTERM domain-containing protein, partial [Janthinobacterium lividum]
KQIGLAIIQYANDYDEATVPRSSAQGKAWTQTLQPYVKNQNVFQCPSNPRKDQPQYSDDGSTVGFTSYAANYHGGIRDVSTSDPVVLLAAYVAPASTINIVESTAHYSNFNIDYPPLWAVDYTTGNLATGGSYGPGQDPGCLFSGHTGFSNFLFADGHVKSMRPLATLNTVDGGTNSDNLWRFDNDSFTHAQSINGGPAEPSPTRAQVSLAWSEKLYK